MPKERESRCREALQTCDCREIAKMIKVCMTATKSVYSTKKHDTAADERYFRQAQERLYSELAYALGIEEDAVPDYIAQRIAPCLTSGNHIGPETSTLMAIPHNSKCRYGERGAAAAGAVLKP